MSTKKKTKLKLFEITIIGFKTFYVRAKSQSDALMHGSVDEEGSSMGGDIDWEHDETQAKEVAADNVEFIELKRQRMILPRD